MENLAASQSAVKIHSNFLPCCFSYDCNSGSKDEIELWWEASKPIFCFICHPIFMCN